MDDLQTSTAQLSQGPIRYRDTGTGTGGPIVFVHGLLVDSRLWDGVADRLRRDYRCILPDWPMGSHAAPMAADADLSPTGVARIVADFLAELELEDVTVVANDSGGAISQVLVTRHPERVARLVLTNCDTHENFPPFPFNLMPPIARVPGGMSAMNLPLRVRAVRRLTYSMFTRRPIDPALIDSWLAPPRRDGGIRRDARKFTAGLNKRYTLEAAERLASFERPVLLAWAPDDRFFKIGYAERLAEALPDSRIVRIEDAKTFVALDQAAKLAEAIAAFMDETAVRTAAA